MAANRYLVSILLTVVAAAHSYRSDYHGNPLAAAVDRLVEVAVVVRADPRYRRTRDLHFVPLIGSALNPLPLCSV